MKMKLYYAPHTCALSPHIALEESGLPYESIRVDMASRKLPDGSELAKVSPKGYVPALIMDDGNLLTEGAVMVQYIADKAPDKRLAPKNGTLERLRLQEWLNFIATELHKGYGAFYHKDAGEAYREFMTGRLLKRISVLADGLGDKPYLMGDFTVADGYALYVLRTWENLVKKPLPDNVVRWKERIAARPAVKAALAGEGLT
jgi:glutathione S-transferase